MVLVWSHWCGAGIDNIAVPRWEFTRSPFMWREVMGDSTCNWSWLSLTYGSIFHYVELSKTCSRRAFTFTQKRQDVQSGKIIWSLHPRDAPLPRGAETLHAGCSGLATKVCRSAGLSAKRAAHFCDLLLVQQTYDFEYNAENCCVMPFSCQNTAVNAR